MENELIDDVDVDEVMEQEEEEPAIIKRRRPRFTKEDMERRRKQANSPENLEKLKAMREKARTIKMQRTKEKAMEKFKEQAKELGYEPKPEPVIETAKTVVEPPKPEPVPIEPPKIEQPKPTPEPPKLKEKPRRIPKPKKKKRVEYIDDEEEEEEYKPPMRPMIRQQQQLTQRDVDEFIRNKYATMDLQQLEQRMAKQAYDYKYQKYREEIMGNQMFGRY
jgi:hypothetical protein